MNKSKKLSSPFFLSMIVILSMISRVIAHGGHPEDQIVDGIDNSVLAYSLIFLGLIVVTIFAYIWGKKVSEKHPI